MPHGAAIKTWDANTALNCIPAILLFPFVPAMARAVGKKLFMYTGIAINMVFTLRKMRHLFRTGPLMGISSKYDGSAAQSFGFSEAAYETCFNSSSLFSAMSEIQT